MKSLRMQRKKAGHESVPRFFYDVDILPDYVLANSGRCLAAILKRNIPSAMTPRVTRNSIRDGKYVAPFEVV